MADERDPRRRARRDRRRKTGAALGAAGLATLGAGVPAAQAQELSVAPPAPTPDVAVADPAPQPNVEVADPAPQPNVEVAPAPAPAPQPAAPAPAPAQAVQPAAPAAAAQPAAPATEVQPAAPPPAPAPAPAEQVQPAATAEQVQPAATAEQVQPAATAEQVQPAATAEQVQPAATAEQVQPAATVEETPAESSDEAHAQPAAEPEQDLSVRPTPAPSEPRPALGVRHAADALNSGREAVEDGAAAGASQRGHALRTSDEPAVRSGAGEGLKSAGKLKAATKGVGTLAKPVDYAFDYTAERTAGRSELRSFGHASASTLGGALAGGAAAGLCAPGVIATAGFGAPLCITVIAGSAATGDAASGAIFNRLWDAFDRRGDSTSDRRAAPTSAPAHPPSGSNAPGLVYYLWTLGY